MAGIAESPPSWSRGTTHRLVTYLSGCVLFSVGAYLFIHSELGTDPLDVFALGLLRHVPLTVGIAQGIIAAICILVWAAWYRRRPVLMPFVTFFFCGSLIDLLLFLEPARFLPVPAFATMLLATMLCAYASSLIIMSGVGIRAMDLVAIAMVEKWGWQFWVAKMSMEGILLLTGYLMGGPVGIGTVCFLVVVDTLIQPFMWMNERVLRMPNLGMPTLQKVS
ncbi:YczE/YyaS/YitT family protein [Streptomyces sp. ARC14]|uniref:YczE/YyaS/YitT family protein n=1 Tax=Streptomyces sp. ARC14 TaxID=2724152 RepID=UPI003857C369